MSQYSNNAIYTRIRESVLTAFPFANVTGTYTPTPSLFPTVFAREIGRFTPPRTQTLSNSQEIAETTWEVQVYSNLVPGAKEQAYALLDAVKTALRPLYLIETMENPLDTAAGQCFILVARFRRVIGSGEDMP